ncbi:unnamed protein product [Trichogramma brassicae]|uniref:Uncharacterized protein n=1 Tax=Trichogramma brassicae TaxID=86971 RepID=A0A6H5HVJ9_9HYME|nr:unnamed protein product [Trichogramma brassicae]
MITAEPAVNMFNNILSEASSCTVAVRGRCSAPTRPYKEEEEEASPTAVVADAEGEVGAHRHTVQTSRISLWSLCIKKFDVNYTDESGYTHFYAACWFGCVKVVRGFLEHGQDPNCIWPETGDSALHFALSFSSSDDVMILLLRAGASPNLANKKGLTPLHLIAEIPCFCQTVKLFFQINGELNQMVQINARDKSGDTPLHVALKKCHEKNEFEVLLRNGASPNLANDEGSTPLHIICKRNQHDVDEMAEFFFKVNDELNQLVQINARDKLGDTPLHVALKKRQEEVLEVLLRNGSDPNLANDEGSTPLHIICKRNQHDVDDMAELFFEINDELNQQVQVDVRDNLGRTPLQWAVMSCLPRAVESLLNRGADLSSFVFPSFSQFDECFKSYKDLRRIFRLTSGLLAAVECLEKRGYELEPRGVMMIIILFKKHELFQASEDLDELLWYDDDEELANEARQKMVKSDLSLYDLIHLRPHEAAKRLTYMDYYELARQKNVWWIRSKMRSANYARFEHLCETMSRKFFRSWALDPFWKLIHYRLPLECSINLYTQSIFRSHTAPRPTVVMPKKNIILYTRGAPPPARSARQPPWFKKKGIKLKNINIKQATTKSNLKQLSLLERDVPHFSMRDPIADLHDGSGDNPPINPRKRSRRLSSDLESDHDTPASVRNDKQGLPTTSARLFPLQPSDFDNFDDFDADNQTSSSVVNDKQGNIDPDDLTAMNVIRTPEGGDDVGFEGRTKYEMIDERRKRKVCQNKRAFILIEKKPTSWARTRRVDSEIMQITLF